MEGGSSNLPWTQFLFDSFLISLYSWGMKYFLLALLLFGCTDQDRCEFGNGSRAFMGTPQVKCTSPTKSTPRTLTSEWEKIEQKGPANKLPGKFKVIDKNSPFYKCHGTIESGAYLTDQLVWAYFFTTMQCGEIKPQLGSEFFIENQIKRTGNLADQ